jgi:hypothetical protein
LSMNGVSINRVSINRVSINRVSINGLSIIRGGAIYTNEPDRQEGPKSRSKNVEQRELVGKS